MPWFVYMLECRDGSLYTGITTDLDRRVWEHNHSPLGAKYTRGRRPVLLVFSVEVEDKSRALKEERRIKGLGRESKMRLFK